MQAQAALCAKVSVGGFVIVDDYGAVAGCRQAVTEFRVRQAIKEPMSQIDWGGAYWLKKF